MVQGRLQSANIGDSGFVVLGETRQKRHFHVKFHTPQQEHSFGCPYQLGHGDNMDHPDSAMLHSLPVRCPVMHATRAMQCVTLPLGSEPGGLTLP